MTNEYSILCNMYYSGNVKHESMGTLKTKNFIIELIREDINKEFLDIQFYYRCTMIFKDLLGRELLRLTFHEAQASALIDNISTFIYDGYNQLAVLSDIIAYNMYETYSIILSIEDENEENFGSTIIMKILCTNNVTRFERPILSITLSLEELDKLCDMMFFIYLIDLVSNREGIYSI